MMRAATALLLLVASVPAQDVPKHEPASKPARPDRRWPPLRSVRKSLTKDNIPLLGSKDAKRAAKARKLIRSYGAGACPVLLAALTRRQKPRVLDALRALLDELIRPEHAWPLTTAYTGRNAVRDAYVVGRLASFRRQTLVPFFRRAAKHKDAAIAESARLALARLGDLEALPFLFELARNRWKDKNYPVREAAAALKGRKATDWLMDKLTDNDTTTKVAALRLLGAAGTKDAVHAIGSYLDAREHQLRAGAVNALRGIVDGAPPFRHLSVFQAIEEVKKWKRKIGR